MDFIILVVCGLLFIFGFFSFLEDGWNLGRYFFIPFVVLLVFYLIGHNYLKQEVETELVPVVITDSAYVEINKEMINLNKTVRQNFKEGDLIEIKKYKGAWSFGIYFCEYHTYKKHEEEK